LAGEGEKIQLTGQTNPNVHKVVVPDTDVTAPDSRRFSAERRELGTARLAANHRQTLFPRVGRLRFREQHQRRPVSTVPLTNAPNFNAISLQTSLARRSCARARARGSRRQGRIVREREIRKSLTSRFTASSSLDHLGFVDEAWIYIRSDWLLNKEFLEFLYQDSKTILYLIIANRYIDWL